MRTGRNRKYSWSDSPRVQQGRPVLDLCNEAEPLEILNDSPLGEDGWAQLAPFGDFANVGLDRSTTPPKRIRGIQRMDRAAAEALVAAFHAPLSRVKRWFRGLPIYHGHPDSPLNGASYPDKEPKGLIGELEVRADGLYARPVFNAAGLELLNTQPGLGFSARWLANTVGEENGVQICRPSQLLSAGLTTRPNLPVELLNDTPVNNAAIIAALRSAGLLTIPDNADAAALAAGIDQIAGQLRAAQTDLSNERATSAVIPQLNTDLTAARAAATAAQADLARLQVELTNERQARAGLLISGAIEGGRITAAQEPAWKEKFSADFANASAELGGLASTLKTRGKDLSGRAAEAGGIMDRQRQFLELVNEKLKLGVKYDDAYAATLKTHGALVGQPAAA
jgi:hypothetical protein